MAEQVPSIGRIVHFVYGGAHVPAIITDADYAIQRELTDTHVHTYQALTVFMPNGAPWTTVAHQDTPDVPGTWHWPEYVPGKD